MAWYKFLAAGGTGAFSGHRWPMPRADAPGGWVSSEGPLEPCRNGLHLCRTEDLPFWLLDELYTVDVDGPVTEHDSFGMVRRARLSRRVVGWDQPAAYRFGCDCAWQVGQLAARALAHTGGVGDADRLTESTTVAELARAAQAADASDELGSRLAGYTADAAGYAAIAESGSGWAAAAATCGLIAATAARVAAAEVDGPDAAAAERLRQAGRLVELAGVERSV